MQFDYDDTYDHTCYQRLPTKRAKDFDVYQLLVALDGKMAEYVEGDTKFLLAVLALRAAIKAVKPFF